MTTADVVEKKNRSAWIKAGVAVEASSAAQVAEQAGLNWNVQLAEMQAYVSNPVNEFESVTDYYPVPKKQAVLKVDKDNNNQVIGVVGSKYKVFQNAEVFGSLDTLIDSGEARYAAAGEYDGGAKVWMLMSLPREMEIKGDPHAAFLLAKTSHDGSSSVVIRPIIERLFCANQINRIFRAKNKAHTYTLRHTQNAVLSVSDMRNILDLTYTSIDEYSNLANHLMQREADISKATAYFKKVWALPTKIENAPLHLLSKGEKNAKSRALNARQKAFAIYSDSPTQENIRGTEFGLWQAVVEYADHYSQKDASIATLAGRNDGIKLRALELIRN
jgi:phage/plasmid-like protein (TIGR03299 family)